jgi:DNA-binding HxlR family transcriptional regulator
VGSPGDDPIREREAAAADPHPPRSGARAGGRTLTILATPLNFQILRALTERPMRLAELRKATGLPAQTTLRGHLAGLSDLGVLARRPTQRMPYAVEHELTPMGRELLEVARRLNAWLARAPDGPISLESGAAKGAIRALIDGWDSTIMRVLAAQPLSLTELDSQIPELSYPALERRLSSMRIAGLVEPVKSKGSGTPYTVTDWARQGVAPLAAAGRCELLHLGPASTLVSAVDVEAAFLLATPLIGLSEQVAGACQLEVEPSPGVVSKSTGIQVTFERGRVVACVSRLEPRSPAYAVGSAVKWFDAVDQGAFGGLHFGGTPQLAEDVVRGLHASFTET